MPSGDGLGESTTRWVEDLATAVVVIDAHGVVAANAAAATLFGVEPETLLGEGLFGCLEETQVAGTRAAFDAAVAGGATPPDELVVRVEPKAAGAKPTFLACTFGPPRDGRVAVSLADATEFFHVMMLLAYSANTTMVIDPEAQILWGPVGRYAAQELDSPWYGRGEANPLGWLHPEDMGRVLEAFTHVLERPGFVHELTVRTRHVILEDQWGTAMIRAINLLDDPLIAGVLIQTHAEGEEEKVSLGRTTGSFQSIAHAAPIGIILSDHRGRSLYWNTVARYLFDLGPIDRSDGATEADVDWVGMADPAQVDSLRKLLDDALVGHRGMATARFELPTGSYWLSVTVAPQLNDVGEPMGWLATFQDITREREIQHELESTQQRLMHLASHDPLTELANRRLFGQQLSRAMARHRRGGPGVGVLFCDLDGFKPVNDSHGHDIGDAVLVEVAQRMAHAIRTQDLAARIGGDEFVVLVEGLDDPTELEAIARRLLDAAAKPITVSGKAVRIGVSIGVAWATTADTADSLLSRADDLMYQAKAAGRGRYVLDPVLAG